MQERNVLEFPARLANGTNDLLSRLYREIGISAVAAALEINHPQEPQPYADVHIVPAAQPEAR